MECFSDQTLAEIRSGARDLDTITCMMSFDQIVAACAASADFQKTLHPSDSRHESMIEKLDGGKWIAVYWGGYAYEVELSRVKSPHDILPWIVHISEKNWPHATAKRIGLLIEKICRAKGWNAHGPFVHPNQAPAASVDKTAEREKMTPSLRYEVIKRDGYRCRACGASVSSGAHLHVDHIIPVAKGGMTTGENLQTLCTVCNIGKRDL